MKGNRINIMEDKDLYPRPIDKIALYNYAVHYGIATFAGVLNRSILSRRLEKDMPFLSSVYRELILDSIGV